MDQKPVCLLFAKKRWPSRLAEELCLLWKWVAYKQLGLDCMYQEMAPLCASTFVWPLFALRRKGGNMRGQDMLETLRLAIPLHLHYVVLRNGFRSCRRVGKLRLSRWSCPLQTCVQPAQSSWMNGKNFEPWQIFCVQLLTLSRLGKLSLLQGMNSGQ